MLPISVYAGEAVWSCFRLAPQNGLRCSCQGMHMRNSASGKLLTFPARTLPPDSMEHWIDQILQTKDHLVDALERARRLARMALLLRGENRAVQW